MSAVDHKSAWLAERNTLIGASEVASIFGVGFETAKDVWARKVGRVVLSDDDEEEETEAMAIGNIIQPAIIEIARQTLGVDIIDEPPFTVRRHPSIHWLGASLDARIEDREMGMIPLDAKNVGHYLASDWSEEPPLKYQVQMQTQMAVTGAKTSILFALVGGNKTCWHTIERNEAFIETMLAKLEEFWGYVTRGEEPPDELSDPVKVAKAIAKLHARDSGETVTLPCGAIDTLNEIEAAKAAIKKAEEAKARAENKIKEAIGDATFGSLADGRYVSWKTQTRAEYVVSESTFRVLRVHKSRPRT